MKWNKTLQKNTQMLNITKLSFHWFHEWWMTLTTVKITVILKGRVHPSVYPYPSPINDLLVFLQLNHFRFASLPRAVHTMRAGGAVTLVFEVVYSCLACHHPSRTHCSESCCSDSWQNVSQWVMCEVTVSWAYSYVAITLQLPGYVSRSRIEHAVDDSFFF